MEILAQGNGELIGWHDPDENRRWLMENKSRELRDKRTTVAQAVRDYIHDGDYLALGGFGHIRVAMAVIYEIIRQRREHIVLAGKTAVHDADLLLGAGCVDRIEVAYAFAQELRGLSPAGRRAVETGACRVIGEISNAGYQWRFLAGMLGIPFIPSRNMLGSDTFTHSACKAARDPWSGKPVCLIPAAYPDVAVFHVPRCDMYGNAQIDGILIMDWELARAARRVIITTEEIVAHEVIQEQPWLTAIPFYAVDAVCEVPFGAHPTTMPYMYYFDEEHIGEWLSQSETPEGTRDYLDKYVYGLPDFAAYLEHIGGATKRAYLEDVEHLRQPLRAPWLDKK